MIRNINEKWGDAIRFDTVEAMEDAIEACGYTLPDDGLQQGIDYEIDNIGCYAVIEDCWHGRYIPQMFADNYGEAWQGFTEDDIKTVLEGPDTEDYWEAWDNITDNAFFMDASGVKWTLYTNSDTGDLLAISDKFTFED